MGSTSWTWPETEPQTPHGPGKNGQVGSGSGPCPLVLVSCVESEGYSQRRERRGE